MSFCKQNMLNAYHKVHFITKLERMLQVKTATTIGQMFGDNWDMYVLSQSKVSLWKT